MGREEVGQNILKCLVTSGMLVFESEGGDKSVVEGLQLEAAEGKN